MNLSNMKLATRLALGFGMLVLFVLILSGWSLIQTKAIRVALEEQNAVTSQKLERLYTVREALAQTGLAARNAFIFPEEDRARAELDIVDQQKALYLKELEALAPHFPGDPDFAKVQKGLLSMADELKRPRKYRESKKMIEYGEFLVKECSPLRRQIVADMEVVVKSAQQSLQKEAADVEALIQHSMVFAEVVSVIAVLLSVLVGWLTTRSITIPINRAVKIAQTVAAGDLTSEIVVNSKDETGQLLQALKEMNGSLATMVAQVRSGTETIATASAEIASGNMDLSSRTEQQAASLEETAASMEELTSTVKQNTESAAQANKMAQSASEVAARGGAVVSQVVDTMSAINTSANKIVDIIGVIDGIAFQTNILALNAAVEAARAGEQGRGFAVVATEVRNLAQRSAAAAKEIKGLIGDSVEKVETGTRLVSQAGTTMNEIVDSIRRVTDIMSEISAASVEQSTGIEQVNQSVGQMDQVTQQNAALVEEAAAAAESLQEQAQGLAKVVSVFRLSPGMAAHVGTAVTRPVTQPATRPAPKSLSKPAIRKTIAKVRGTAPARASGAAPVAALPGAAAGGDWEEF